MTNQLKQLLNKTLGKILMKDHAILLDFEAFILNVAKEGDHFHLYLSADDNELLIELHSTSTEAEMVEWLQNSRVSTRRINSLIANFRKYEEVVDEVEELLVTLDIKSDTTAAHCSFSWLDWNNQSPLIDLPIIQAIINHFDLAQPHDHKTMNSFKQALLTLEKSNEHYL